MLVDCQRCCWLTLLKCGRVVSLAGASGTAPLTDGDYTLVNKMLGWPATALFPALDLARLLALDAVASQRLVAAAGILTTASTASGVHSPLPTSLAAYCYVNAAAMSSCECCEQVAAPWVQLSAGATAEPQLAANQQTGLRLICNCFRHPALRQWVQMQQSALLDGFAPAYKGSSKAVRLAAATMLLNFAVARGANLACLSDVGCKTYDNMLKCSRCSQETLKVLCKWCQALESFLATFLPRNLRLDTGKEPIRVTTALLPEPYGAGQ